MTKEELNKLATVHDLENLYQRLVQDLKVLINRHNDHKEFYSPKEFCKTTGMKYSTVIHYCNTGQIKARQGKTKGAWQIHGSELDRFLSEAEENVQ